MQKADMKESLSRRTFLSLSGAAAVFSALAGTLSWHGGTKEALTAEKKHILILTGSAREGGNSDLLATFLPPALSCMVLFSIPRPIARNLKNTQSIRAR